MIIVKQEFIECSSIEHINEKLRTNSYGNHPYYIFNDMINIKDFDPNLLNISKISFEATDVVFMKLNILQQKVLTMKILIVKIFCILFLIM